MPAAVGLGPWRRCLGWGMEQATVGVTRPMVARIARVQKAVRVGSTAIKMPRAATRPGARALNRVAGVDTLWTQIARCRRFVRKCPILRAHLAEVLPLAP